MNGTCQDPTESGGPGPRGGRLSVDFISGGRRPSEGVSRAMM